MPSSDPSVRGMRIRGVPLDNPCAPPENRSAGRGVSGKEACVPDNAGELGAVQGGVG